MAFQLHRLRRALPPSYSLLERCFHGCKPKPISSISASRLLPTPAPTTQLMRRPFTSTTTLFRRAFNPETDEIGPDTILFEGCDYKHWLITVDFPKDSNMTREQMIETYVDIAAQVFGSVEEAKKRIYALSTTTYVGFQVECSEETSEKFKSIPAVVFVLPDSYIDPVNKEYGGDKYVNGEIFSRPPPVHYGRRSNSNRRPSPQQNYGPPSSPQQQNYGPPSSQQSYQPPPSQQNYRPPPSQQNYGSPPSQLNYGPPSQQNYVPPPSQQNYVPPPSQQNYVPPPSQQNYGLPPSQPNYGPPPSQQNYGPPPSQQNYGPPPSQQNYGPPPQRNYGSPQHSYTPQPHQSYGPPPQQSYVPNTQGHYGNAPNLPPHPNNSPAGPGARSGYMPPNNTSRHDERNPASSYQGNFNRAQPGQRGFSQDANYGSPQDQAFGQVSGGHRNFSSSEKN